MEIHNLDPNYHDKGRFREQIAALYRGHVDDECIIMVRSYLHVCLPGAASFDPEKPGADSAASWERINNMIENDGVCGIFHTHPLGIVDFSGQDWQSMRATAMAMGKRYLFYGVQALNSLTARYVCLNMLGGKVFCYDYGFVESDPSSLVVKLPLPQKVEWVANAGIYVI